MDPAEGRHDEIDERRVGIVGFSMVGWLAHPDTVPDESAFRRTVVDQRHGLFNQ